MERREENRRRNPSCDEDKPKTGIPKGFEVKGRNHSSLGCKW